AEFRQQSAETPLERRQVLDIAGGALECAHLTAVVYQRRFEGRAADVYACNPRLAAHISSVSGGTSEKQLTTERLATDFTSRKGAKGKGSRAKSFLNERVAWKIFGQGSKPSLCPLDPSRWRAKQA